MGETPAIAIERLRKSYGRSRGIDGVDLQVERGEVFGYLGPNGAGKTTTIRVLLGFIRADGGRARLLGRDVRRDGPALRRDLGYMPGELALYGRLTGRQLLRFVSALHGRDASAAGAALAERLDADLDRPLRNLSQGNARKVGLVLAFMHHPALVILDEPTNGLDPLVRQEFYRLLADARAAGQTVFLSSHNLSEVERVCDRVAIIRDGRIAAVEGIGELKARSLRHVTIRFAAAAPAADFSTLSNLRDVSVSGPVLRCRVLGDMDPLLKAASRHVVKDFLSQEADLEEIFLTYYGTGTHAS